MGTENCSGKVDRSCRSWLQGCIAAALGCVHLLQVTALAPCRSDGDLLKENSPIGSWIQGLGSL